METSKLTLLLIKMSATTSINSFLYFAQKLPLIGKHISDKVYGYVSAKNVLSVLGFIYSLVMKLLGNSLLVALAALFASMFSENEEAPTVGAFVMSFVFLCCIGGGIMSGTDILRPDRDRYIVVRITGVDAGRYTLHAVFFTNAVTAVCYYPPMLVASLIFGRPLAAIILPLLWYALRIIFCAAGLGYYRAFKKRPGSVSLIAGVAVWAAYVLLMELAGTGFDWLGIVFSPYLLAAVAAASVLCALSLVRYKGYAAATVKLCTYAAVANADSAPRSAAFADVALNEKKAENVTSSIVPGDRSGGPVAYLCRVFFARHKRILVRPTVIRCCLVLAAGLLAVIVSFFDDGALAKALAENAGSVYKALPFVVYLLSTGAKCAKAMFYNCDISLLRFPFYRQPGMLLRCFALRLQTVALLGLAPALLLGAGLFIMNLRGGGALTVSYLCLLMCVMLSLFFSVHHLVMYYILQPYTSSLEVKNSFFSIINFIVYFVCYGCLNSDLRMDNLVYIVIALTAVYIAVALVLVWKLAPKRFKIK